MCMVEDNQVVDVRGVCKVQAEAPAPVRPLIEDDFSCLPPSMRRHVIASINRNREAFTRLAKL
jgi:hypothetical protein